jgi:PBSX family phage terminase large subunit
LKLVPFSEKQIKVLTWWARNSKYEKYDAIICDGAIRSGKTVCMSISFVLWAFYRFNNVAFALCGKTIRSLRRNVVTPLIPILTDLGFLCRQKISENIIEISYDGRYNIFYLFGGKDEASSSLIQGITLAGIFFDEVALMPKSFVEQALARCSIYGSKFWFNCNPEYPGHWFYKEWIVSGKQKNAFYLHFKMSDNPSLPESVIARYEKLYTGTFYQRFIEGRWVAVEGLIYPYMTKENAFCSVPNFEFSRYAVSCDYGIVNPTSCGLWGECGDIWYRIDEYYYDSRKEGETRTDEEHYKCLCDLLGDKYISCITVDPSAASFITLIRKHGRFHVIPAKNNVVDGIREVANALKQGRIKICITCENSMREFSLYRWGGGGTKDVPLKENDHAMDDIRYFVTTRTADDDEPFFALAAQR